MKADLVLCTFVIFLSCKIFSDTSTDSMNFNFLQPRLTSMASAHSRHFVPNDNAHPIAGVASAVLVNGVKTIQTCVTDTFHSSATTKTYTVRLA